MSGTVQVDQEGFCAVVTLASPGKLNAMSRAMWRELKRVFTDLHAAPGLRSVLVRGEGGHFCAGGDISEYPDFRFDEAMLREFHETDVWGGLQAMLDCDLPVIAQIDGHCLGAGLEIACACDLRVASRAARFGAPIAKLGFPMAPREAALVMRAAGELTAREMLLSAAVLEADEMKLRGFLNQVVPADETSVAARACATRMAQLAPGAARQNKATFRAFAQSNRAQVATDLIAEAYRYAPSAEHREGVTAFTEKRRPQF
jgi:enoyl-CoA hydratase/carnithine racemase